jgi:hypothetical protein
MTYHGRIDDLNAMAEILVNQGYTVSVSETENPWTDGPSYLITNADYHTISNARRAAYCASTQAL